MTPAALAAIRARHEVFTKYVKEMPHHSKYYTLDLRVETLHADRAALLDYVEALEVERAKLTTELLDWKRTSKGALDNYSLDLEQAQAEARRWEGLCKQFCDEALEAGCPPTCDKWGHGEDCTATSVLAYVRNLKAEVRHLREVHALAYAQAALDADVAAAPTPPAP